MNPVLKQIDTLLEEFKEGRYIYLNPSLLAMYKLDKLSNYRGLIIVKDYRVPPEQILIYKEKLTINQTVSDV